MIVINVEKLIIESLGRLFHGLLKRKQVPVSNVIKDIYDGIVI